jgi:hypothetical protein
MAAEEEHMNRTEVLSRAFQAISWPDAPFEPCMGDLDRLSRSASSSAEVLAMHSLARVHAWLWPQVASATLGSVLALGGMTAETVRDDEDGKILSLSKGDDRWMLAWTGMGGDDPSIRLGLADPARDSGQRRIAYCTVPSSGIRKGRLMAERSDVGRMFGLFSDIRAIMPAEHLKVMDGSRNDERLTDVDLDRVLEIDGGLGGPAAAQLHRIAEQHAASIIFRWAAAKYDHVSRFLLDNGIVFGSHALKFSDGDRIICGIETGDERQRAIFDSRFPHEHSGNRFLTWIDFSHNGAVAAVHSLSIPADERLADVVRLLKSGDLQPTVTHEYASGSTLFSPGGAGMQHLANMAESIEQASFMAARFDPKDEGAGYELIVMDGPEAIPAIGR